MQKGFSTILGILIGLLVIGGGVYYFIDSNTDEVDDVTTEESNRWDVDENDTSDDTQYVRRGDEASVDTNDEDNVDDEEVVEQQINEDATGIIKAVYSQNGRNFLDIDYVIKNTDWKPGGNSGPAYTNENPKIRTFEISKNVEIFVGSGTFSIIKLSEFTDLFIPTDTVNGVDIYPYQASGLWDIEVSGGVVTKITEYFLP
jgi:hypothetical protein